MLHFCTYFNRNYVARGLALHASLLRHCEPFTLWVLCLDDDTERILTALALPGLVAVPLPELESADLDLLGVKPSRPLVEYYFTTGPTLVRYLFRSRPEIEFLTYLDSDLFFFASPAPALGELSTASVGLVSHHVDSKSGSLFGEFNDGWVSFRRNQEGLKALEWWRERCLESCDERPETGVCGAQKYLTDLPRISQGVVVISQKGANLAPWNYGRFRLSRRDKKVVVDEDPLLWFHFGDFRLRMRYLLSPSYAAMGMRPSRVLRVCVLTPYARTLAALDRALEKGGFIARLTGVSIVPGKYTETGRPKHGGFRAQTLRVVRWIRRTGNYVFLPFRIGGKSEPEVKILSDHVMRSV